MTLARARLNGGFLLALVALGVAPQACSRPHACAGEPPCVAEAHVSARARCELPGDAPDCACGAVDWGGACSKHVDCKCGLECVDAVCESVPRCAGKDAR